MTEKQAGRIISFEKLKGENHARNPWNPGAPIVFTLGIHGMNPILFLLADGLIAAWYLVRDKGFSRSSFDNLLSLKKHCKRIGATFLLLSLPALGVIFFLYPQY